MKDIVIRVRRIRVGTPFEGWRALYGKPGRPLVPVRNDEGEEMIFTTRGAAREAAKAEGAKRARDRNSRS